MTDREQIQGADKIDLPDFSGEKLSTRVVRELQGQILRGELQSRQRLPPAAELSQLLGVSMSVIRDATRTLAAKGLVDVRQGHGISVSEPEDTGVGEAILVRLLRSDITVGDLVGARAMIETRLGPLATVSATDDDVRAIEERFLSFADAVERGQRERATSEHLGFHVALLGALHLPVLELILKPMDEIILITSLPGGTDEGWDIEEHRRIFESLRERDQAGMEKALEQHFSYINTKRYAKVRTTRLAEVSTIEDLLAWLGS